MSWTDLGNGKKHCEACKVTFRQPLSCKCPPAEVEPPKVEVEEANPHKERAIAELREIRRLADDTREIREAVRAAVNGDEGIEAGLVLAAPVLQKLIEQERKCRKDVAEVEVGLARVRAIENGEKLAADLKGAN